MNELVVGQRVWLFDINARGRGPERGTVVKVGRKLATIEYDGRWSFTRTFRLESGEANDQYGHHWFVTDEQKELNDRRTAATDELYKAGLEIRHGYRLSVDTLEALAALVGGSEQ